MTERSDRPVMEPDRFPLSSPQELWCSGDLGDQSGTFSCRFILVDAWRVAGRVDVAALQGALDDVVVRHELLRTIVVRDAEPPYQRVHPPRPVPLQVRDLTPATDPTGGARTTDRPRDLLAEELIMEAEQGTLNPREAPGLRAVLSRFDDRDSVLILVAHHTACDGWSMQLIMRDLAAFYTARTTGRPAVLPAVRQYREYAAWQQASLTGPASASVREYWHQKLRGARIFAMPTDRAIPELHSRPYSAHNFGIDADVISVASAMARAMRSSTFMVLLAAFNVLAHQITGETDVVINTLTTGRIQPQFHDTVGPFLNFLALRTDIGGCTSFRDIVARTRETCIEAYSHEIPIQQVERELPELMQPLENPMMCDFIFGVSQPQFSAPEIQLADGSYQISKRVLQEPESNDIPGGLAWNMDILPIGELSGRVQFNLDEFDEGTIVNWVSGYRRILSRAVGQPGRAWKTL